MISVKNVEKFAKNADGVYVHSVEGVCLSTDTKPTNWANGSTLLEMDTSKVFVYDATNNTWNIWTGNSAVASVNGKTGTVVLDAADVGAIAAPSSPTSGDVLAYDGTAWVAQNNSGDDAFFVVEVTTNWWTDPPSKAANCTWSELNTTTKPILWNGQIVQKWEDLSSRRIAYISPSFSYGASSYEVHELAFEATGYTVVEHIYTTNIGQVITNIAPLYFEYQTYNVGDLVIYNNTLYQCTTAVSTPESFDLSKWARTTIATVIASIRNA